MRQAFKYPYSRHLWLRQTRISLNETILETFEGHVLPDAKLESIADGPKRGCRSAYSTGNGSQIVLGGLDHVTRIMSSEYDTICVFEATEIEEEAYLHLLTRLRNHKLPYQQILCECNPSHPDHWLIKRVKAGSMTRYPSKHTDNPSVTPEYLKRLDSLTGYLRARLLSGEWVCAEGAIYPMIEAAIVDDVSSFTPFMGGCDFGFRDPHAVVIVGKNELGKMAVCADYELAEQPIDIHAAWMRQWYGVEYRCDPSRPDSIQQLQSLGVNACDANNSILDGVSAVARALSTGDLVVSSKCTSLLRSLRSMRWSDVVKEKPEPGDDHLADALRYAVMGAAQSIGFCNEVI